MSKILLIGGAIATLVPAVASKYWNASSLPEKVPTFPAGNAVCPVDFTTPETAPLFSRQDAFLNEQQEAPFVLEANEEHPEALPTLEANIAPGISSFFDEIRKTGNTPSEAPLPKSFQAYFDKKWNDLENFSSERLSSGFSRKQLFVMGIATMIGAAELGYYLLHRRSLTHDFWHRLNGENVESLHSFGTQISSLRTRTVSYYNAHVLVHRHADILNRQEFQQMSRQLKSIKTQPLEKGIELAAKWVQREHLMYQRNAVRLVSWIIKEKLNDLDKLVEEDPVQCLDAAIKFSEMEPESARLKTYLQKEFFQKCLPEIRTEMIQRIFNKTKDHQEKLLKLAIKCLPEKDNLDCQEFLLNTCQEFERNNSICLMGNLTLECLKHQDNPASSTIVNHAFRFFMAQKQIDLAKGLANGGVNLIYFKKVVPCFLRHGEYAAAMSFIKNWCVDSDNLLSDCQALLEKTAQENFVAQWKEFSLRLQNALPQLKEAQPNEVKENLVSQVELVIQKTSKHFGISNTDNEENPLQNNFLQEEFETLRDTKKNHDLKLLLKEFKEINKLPHIQALDRLLFSSRLKEMNYQDRKEDVCIYLNQFKNEIKESMKQDPEAWFPVALKMEDFLLTEVVEEEELMRVLAELSLNYLKIKISENPKKILDWALQCLSSRETPFRKDFIEFAKNFLEGTNLEKLQEAEKKQETEKKQELPQQEFQLQSSFKEICPSIEEEKYNEEPFGTLLIQRQNNN